MATSPAEFVDDFLPLALCVNPSTWDDAELDRMFRLYERLFKLGTRYALVTCDRSNGQPVSARARKAIAEWANTPAVREKSAKLCVGSSTIVSNPVARGAMTAVLWLWKPPSPYHLAGSREEAVDWCLSRLEDERIALPMPRQRLREAVLTKIRSF